jgi:hypothetical protein
MALPVGAKAVNLGCGLSIAPHWINIDNSPNARPVEISIAQVDTVEVRRVVRSALLCALVEDKGVHNLKKPLPYADSLTAILNNCRFINAVACEHKKGRMPDCDTLDNRPEESLYLEAEKPG